MKSYKSISLLISLILTLCLSISVTTVAANQTSIQSIECDCEQNPDCSKDCPAPVDQAFKASARVDNRQTLAIQFEIEEGYYLYEDSIKFSSPSDVSLHKPILPAAITKEVPGVGSLDIYHKNIIFPLPISPKETQNLQLVVQYQGCSAAGFCYPPIAKKIDLNLNNPNQQFITGVDTTISSSTPEVIKHDNNPNTLTQEKNESYYDKLLSSKSLLMISLIFLGTGLLMSLTPCVLPMIPILSSLVIGQKPRSTLHAFLLSLSYVLGMGIAYAVIGVVFGFIGESIQTLLQQAWINILFAVIFALMAAAMLANLDIKMPSFLQNKINNSQAKLNKGSFFGVFLMGMMATLVLSPCITPVLVGALAFIAHSCNITSGAIALFFLGIGMGIPLLIIGTGAKWLLPKSGNWMSRVTQIMGFILIGMAIFTLSRVLSPLTIMYAYAVLFLVFAVCFSSGTIEKNILSKARLLIAALAFSYAVVLFIGAAKGHTDPLAPLPNQAQVSTCCTFDQNGESNHQHIKVTSLDQLDKQLKIHSGQPIHLDFFATWCTACVHMTKTVFTDEKVKQGLKHYVSITVDITQNDKDSKELLKAYNIVGTPVNIFLNQDHQEVKRFSGERNAEQFLNLIPQINNS